jgi:hypothetical protein
VAAPILGAAITTLTTVETWYSQVVFELQLDDIPGSYSFSFLTIDVIFLVLSLAYGLFPILYNYFGLSKKHAQHTAKEYYIVTKILHVEIPLLVILTILTFYYYFLLEEGDMLFLKILGFTNMLFIENLGYTMLYSVVGGLLWIAFNKINKDFNFCLAKGCFENMLEKNEMEVIQSLTRGLRYYNKYLKRVLKLQINNVDGVTSKLLSDSKVDKNKAIESIYHAFEGNDRFQPITCISTTLDIQETEKFLVKQPVAEKIKDWTTYIIATIIPFMVSIIQFLFPADQTQPPG